MYLMIHCDIGTLQPSERRSDFADSFLSGYKKGLQKHFWGCKKKASISVFIN